jgi:arginase
VRRVSLIGAASGWGAGIRETENGPEALRDFGLADALQAAGIDAGWTAMVEPEKRLREAPDLSRDAIFDLVVRLDAALADAVAGSVAAGTLPVVIGGDHSIAVGTWGGVARGRATQGPAGAPFGLIWFDAHLDAHTPATTPSGNPHGMSAAVLLGHGDDALLAIGGAVLRPENLCYIGARSYEPGELALLERLGVRIVYMDEIHRRGLQAVVDDAVAIATNGTSGFGITIDLDGFEPDDAPGIGLKTPDGLRRDDMLAALAGLAGRPDLAAIEIVEYVPELDIDRRTARLARDLLLALLAPQAHARSRQPALPTTTALV